MHGIALAQCTPVLAIDLWEHAYFNSLFEGNKAAYFESLWAHINWGQVSHNFEAFALQGKVAPLLPS
jgi:superoxide dismutase